MTKTNNRKIDNFKLYYIDGATLIGKHKLPQLAPTHYIPENVISFNQRKGISNPENHWVDFFIDDYQFEGFWNHPEKSFSNLRKFKGIITPDFSMLPEMQPDQYSWNCTRNRNMAYYLQQQGFPIIPVASWKDEHDFDWCFDGLPQNSSIAISNNGCLSNSYSLNILLSGIETLQQLKRPSTLIICGRHMKELDNYSNILYYPSFSQ